MTLRPYQQAAVEAVANEWRNGNRETLLVAATGAGKAQPLTSQILTPYGFVPMGEIHVGSQVIGSDGAAHVVTGVYPQGVLDTYAVRFSDGTYVECCGDHLWAVQTKSQKHRRPNHWAVKKTVELIDDLFEGLNENKWFLPIVAPVQFSPVILPIDPYVLGVLLGDGYFASGKNGSYINFSSADAYIVEEMTRRLDGIAQVRHIRNYDYSLHVGRGYGAGGSFIGNTIRGLGLSGTHSYEKFVPIQYLRADVESRVQLLRGLMDTDGTVSVNGKAAEFSTTSRQLAQDVCELVRSLGGVTSVRSKAPGTYTYKGEHRVGRPSYRVRVSIPFNPFALPRKAQYYNENPKQGRTKAIIGIEPIGPQICQCISVSASDSLYVTDGYTLTHNTQLFLHLVMSALDADPAARALIVAHRRELIEQPLERIRLMDSAWLMRGPIDRPRVGLITQGYCDTDRQLTVATIQSLNDKRLGALLSNGVITHLVIDEAHHGTSNSYLRARERLLAANPYLYHLGVTATPLRADGDGLARVYASVAAKITIADLVRDGWLVMPRWLAVTTKVSLKSVHSRSGDYVTAELAGAVETTGFRELVVEAYQKYAAGRRFIAFTVSVEGAHALAARFCDAGLRVEAVHGNMPLMQRSQLLNSFRKGEIDGLTNCQVLCLDAETEILTSAGWTGIDDMTYEHQVANWDENRVFFERPKFIVRRNRLPGERMVVLETFRRSIRVTEDHRMLFRKRGQKSFKIIHARDLVNVQGELPVSGIAERFDISPEQPKKRSEKDLARAIRANSYHYRRLGMSSEDARAEALKRISERDSLRYKAPADLSLDECAFIGFWVGDGTVTKLKTGGLEYTFIQSLVYPKIIEWVDELIKRLEIDSIKRVYPDRNENGYVTWSFARGTGFGVQRRRGLFHLEPYLKKDGTELLWGLSSEQFDAFLLGFWYADGNHYDAQSIPESLFISNTNYKLFSLLQGIAVCRGYRSSIRLGSNHIKNEKYKRIYSLGLFKTESHQMTRNTLQFESDWKEERVWCVTSTTGNIITRRKGTVTVVGNTEGFDAPGTSCILMCRPTQSDGLYIQCMGRGLRPANGRAEPGEDCLILDFIPADARNVVMAGDVLGIPNDTARAVRELVKEEAEEGAVQVGFTFDGRDFDMSGSAIEIVTRQLDYLKLSRLAWFPPRGTRNADDVLTVGIGCDSVGTERILAIRDGKLYGIGRRQLGVDLQGRPRYDAWRAYRIECDDPYDRAERIAEAYGDQQLLRRDRGWRQGLISEKQQAYLQRLSRGRLTLARIRVLSRGEANQWIARFVALDTMGGMR